MSISVTQRYIVVDAETGIVSREYRKPPAPKARVVGNRWSGQVEDLARHAPVLLPVLRGAARSSPSGMPIG